MFYVVSVVSVWVDIVSDDTDRVKSDVKFYTIYYRSLPRFILPLLKEL